MSGTEPNPFAGRSLFGQTAIVTGGARGIGLAISRALAACGARVIVNYHSSEEAAKALVEELGEALAVRADVSTEEGCRALFAAATPFGGADIVVNNAGITRDGLLMRMSDEDWFDVLETNTNSVFRMCRLAIAPTNRGGGGMLKRRSGVIINVSSVTAIRGNPGQTNYAASKAAIIGFSQSLAKEVAKRGVRVNVVVPGFIETDMTDALDDALQQEIAGLIPMQRMGQAVDVAHAVTFLSSSAAQYITGHSLIVDGGLTA